MPLVWAREPWANICPLAVVVAGLCALKLLLTFECGGSITWGAVCAALTALSAWCRVAACCGGCLWRLGREGEEHCSLDEIRDMR